MKVEKGPNIQKKKEVRTAAPLFVPVTRNSVLANCLKMEEEKLLKLQEEEKMIR